MTGPDSGKDGQGGTHRRVLVGVDCPVGLGAVIGNATVPAGHCDRWSVFHNRIYVWNDAIFFFFFFFFSFFFFVS